MSVADQEVHLQLGPNHILKATQYDIRVGIFEQPGAFSLQLGSGVTCAQVLHDCPKNSPFEVIIVPTVAEGGCPIFSGFTDGNRATGDRNGTEISIKGRGTLKFFYDSFHEKESTYTVTTFKELIEKAMDEVEMVRAFTDGQRPTVRTTNAAVREFRTGTSISAEGDEFSTELEQQVGTVGNAHVVLRAKLGERWSDVLQRALNQQGLFMWDAENGDIVIGRPNPNQKPIYRIVRKMGKSGISNVLSFSFEDDLAPRYSEVVIFGRTTGRKYARTTQKGAYTDDELINHGVHKVLVLRDVEVTSTAHAELIARRHIAEGRRRGFYLDYTVSGHCTQLLGSGKTDLIVWTPDTMVEVDDEQLGIQGLFWIENVRYKRNSSGTTTTIRLLDPYSLIFGTDAPVAIPDRNQAVSKLASKNLPIGSKLRALVQSSLWSAVDPFLKVQVPDTVRALFDPSVNARVFEVVAALEFAYPQLCPPASPIPVQPRRVSGVTGKDLVGGKVATPTFRRKA